MSFFKSICSDCKAVDWKSFAEQPLDPNFTQAPPLQGRFVQNLQSQEKLESSPCKCCQMLSTIDDEPESLNPVGQSRWSKRYTFSQIRRLEVTTLGSQVQLRPFQPEQGNLALLRLSTQSKEVEERYIEGKRYIAVLGPGKKSEAFKMPSHLDNHDYAWIRKAISECSSDHSRTHAKCHRKGSQVVPGLQLIDCLAGGSNHLRVVSAPDSCQYAILSYVWGDPRIVSNGVTAVVKDAMKVTANLGLQYLWVDKHCIPQKGPEMQQQIRSMNEVFSKAHICIVAAAGKSAGDGLFGVGTTRVPQTETHISGCTLLELPSILDAVKKSNWVRRAWTLQEGLLSTRCLIFTDRGVMYRCRELYIEQPLQRLVPSDGIVAMDNHSDDTEWILQRLFAVDEGDEGIGMDYLRRRVSDYTKRQLSHEEDSLNAFLGVFTDYEQSSEPVVFARPNPFQISTTDSHLWGLPIDNFGPILGWYHPVPPKSRRHGFPSWSWSGWEGDMEFARDQYTLHFCSKQSLFHPASYLNCVRNSPPAHGPKCLQLSAPIIRLKFASPPRFASQRKIIDTLASQLPANREVMEHRYSQQHSVFEFFPGTFSIIRSYLSIEMKTGDNIFGLLLCRRIADDIGRKERPLNILTCIVVLKELEPEGGILRFSRVGLLTVPDVWNCKHINNKGNLVDKQIFPDPDSPYFCGEEVQRRVFCLQ